MIIFIKLGIYIIIYKYTIVPTIRMEAGFCDCFCDEILLIIK